MTEAVLAEQAKQMGLSVSDQLVAASIMNNPTFKGADGQFNRALFDQALRNVGLSEAGFVQEQRAAMARLHLAEAIAGDINVPVAAKEAMHRYASERRAASYVLLNQAAAGEIPAATPEQLQSFFNERKSDVPRAGIPGRQRHGPRCGSACQARDRVRCGCPPGYEQQKARYGSPERRTIQQITFPSPAEAEAAAAKLKEGTTFEALAAERNVSPRDLELGTFTKAEMLDQAVADAAFALEQGATSAPVAGRFGPVLVRVTQIQPEAVRPFEEVAAELRQGLAVQRAQGQIERIHDEIEDLRAGAKPLADIAKEKGLTLIQVPAVDARRPRQGRQPGRTSPRSDPVVKAAFASDIGVDNEALRTGTRLCLVRRDRHRAFPREDPRRGARSGRRPVARGSGRPAPVGEGPADDRASRQGRGHRGRGAGSRRARRECHGPRPQHREGRSRGRGGQPHLRRARRARPAMPRTGPIPARCSR